MKSSANFNSIEDSNEVDQFGFINLSESYRSGVVSGSNDLEQGNYNDIDDPNNIGVKPSDVFDAMRAAKALRQAGTSAKETNKVTVDTAKN